MPIIRLDRFKANEIRLARLVRAPAHPARIAILHMLASRKSCTCGEIVEALPLAQATVSQHLKEVKEAGLIEGTIEGPSTCYCLNMEPVRELAADMNEWFDKLL